MTEQPVPRDLAAEEAVLGSLILNRDAIIKVDGFLRPADFFDDRYAQIYTAIQALYHRREPPDLVTLQSELDRRGWLAGIGGPGTLAGLMARVPTAVHVEYYAQIVEDRALHRALIQAGGRIAGLGYEAEAAAPLLAQAEAALFHIAQRARRTRAEATLEAAQAAYVDDLLNRLDGQQPTPGWATGLARLDHLTGGYRPGKFWVWIGESGGGKSTVQLATGLAARAAGARVGLYSLEMYEAELAERALAQAADVDSALMRAGAVTEAELSRILAAQSRLGALAPIYLRTGGGYSLADIRAQAATWRAEGGLDVLIIDYLGLVALPGGENRTEKLDELCAGLKGLAAELGICVVSASQLSRDAVGVDPHRWDDYVRGSGGIKHNADVIVAVAPQGAKPVDPGAPWPLLLCCTKQRGGPTGDVDALWWLSTSRIGDVDHRWD